MLTILQLAFLYYGAGTSGSIVEEEDPVSQDSIETVPTASRAESVPAAGTSAASPVPCVPEADQAPVIESQETIGAVVEDLPAYRVPDVEFDAPVPDLGLFDDVEMMPSLPEAEAQNAREVPGAPGEGVVPSSFGETELERELRLAAEFEQGERARSRAQLDELLEAQRLHRVEMDQRRAERAQKGRSGERRRPLEDDTEEANPSGVPEEPPAVESQDTIETVPEPVPNAGDRRDLPCEDTVNGRTGRLRYGLPAPSVNPEACEQCTARRVVCKGHPGRGCFFCIAAWRCACSLATQGRAKRKRGDEEGASSRSKRPKKARKGTGRGTEGVRASSVRESSPQQPLPGPRLARPVVVIERVPRVPRTAPVEEEDRDPLPRQQQQQQQSPPPPSDASEVIVISSGEASPAPEVDAPGPSRFPGSYDDAGDSPPVPESLDELGVALRVLSDDVAMLRRAGISLVEFADEVAAHMADVLSRLDARLEIGEASVKGKGKQRE